MISLKSEEELRSMVEGGRILNEVVKELKQYIRQGVTTESIDKKAEELIVQKGAEPSFKKVPGYRWSTCLPINEQVVHTPPSKRILKDGDILTVDVGVYYKGLHTDFADTYFIGDNQDKKIKKFLDTGRQALSEAIGKAKEGNDISDISEAIEIKIKSAGYQILEDLTGHGIGRELHEDPFIPGFLNKKIKQTPKIKKGMVLAIEVIYSESTKKIDYEKDKEWSIISADKSLTACFEKTVAITETGSTILT